MVRAAAKNHEHVGRGHSPADYPAVLDELRRRGRSRRPPAAVWPGPPSPTLPPTTPPSWPGSTAAAPAAVALDGAASDAADEAALARCCPDPASHARARRGPALRREPAPARRPLPDGGDAELVGRHGPARRKSALATSTSSTVMRPGGWSTSWRRIPVERGGGHHQARQPVRRGGGRRPGRPPTSARSSVTRVGVRRRGRGRRTTSRPRWPRPWPRGPQADVIIALSYAPEAVETLVGRRRATRLLSGPPPERVGPAAAQPRRLECWCRTPTRSCRRAPTGPW